MPYKRLGTQTRSSAAGAVGEGMGSLNRVNFRDALKRVAMVVHQHIVKIEQRYQNRTRDNINSGLFHAKKMDMFSESNFVTPVYEYKFVRVPGGAGTAFYNLKKQQAIFKM